MSMIVPPPRSIICGNTALIKHDRRKRVGFEVVAQQLHRGVDDVVHMSRTDVAAVVDERVDVAPLGEHRLDRPGQRVVIEQIAGNREATPPRRADQLGGLVERTGQWGSVGALQRRAVLARFTFVHRAGKDRDVVAGLGELDCDRLADAAARSGHERDLVGRCGFAHHDQRGRVVSLRQVSRSRSSARRPTCVTVSTSPASARSALAVHRSRGRVANGSNPKWCIAFRCVILSTASTLDSRKQRPRAVRAHRATSCRSADSRTPSTRCRC